MGTNVMRAMVAVAVLGLVLMVGCNPLPEGEQIIGEPSEPAPQPEENQTENGAVAEEGAEMSWSITSSAFNEGEMIPAKYTADGEDISPPLSFEGVPEGTVQLALICHDPDAPRAGGWTHWVVYGMAPEIGGLPEGVPTDPTVEVPGLVQGENSSGGTGYHGPAPPPGEPHRYQFKAYALSEPLDLEPGATQDELEAAMDGKVIGETVLEGLYGRG